MSVVFDIAGLSVSWWQLRWGSLSSRQTNSQPINDSTNGGLEIRDGIGNTGTNNLDMLELKLGFQTSSIHKDKHTMIMTVEISMYPFQEQFRDPIKDFIGKLSQYSAVRTTSGPTSTILVGDYDLVMDCLKEMLRWSHETHGKAVFVAKLLPGYEANEA